MFRIIHIPRFSREIMHCLPQRVQYVFVWLQNLIISTLKNHWFSPWGPNSALSREYGLRGYVHTYLFLGIQNFVFETIGSKWNLSMWKKLVLNRSSLRRWSCHKTNGRNAKEKNLFWNFTRFVFIIDSDAGFWENTRCRAKCLFSFHGYWWTFYF